MGVRCGQQFHKEQVSLRARDRVLTRTQTHVPSTPYSLIKWNGAITGGSIFLSGDASLLLSNVLLLNNTAKRGGAVAAERASLMLMNYSTLVFNTASSGGAAIAASDQVRTRSSIASAAAASHVLHRPSPSVLRLSYQPLPPKYPGTVTPSAAKCAAVLLSHPCSPSLVSGHRRLHCKGILQQLPHHRAPGVVCQRPGLLSCQCAGGGGAV